MEDWVVKDFGSGEHPGEHEWETIDARGNYRGCSRCGMVQQNMGDPWTSLAYDWAIAIDAKNYLKAIALALGVKAGFHNEVTPDE